MESKKRNFTDYQSPVELLIQYNDKSAFSSERTWLTIYLKEQTHTHTHTPEEEEEEEGDQCFIRRGEYHSLVPRPGINPIWGGEWGI